MKSPDTEKEVHTEIGQPPRSPEPLEPERYLHFHPIIDRLVSGFRRRILEYSTSYEDLPGLTEEQVKMLSRLWPQGFGADLKQGYVGDCYLVAALHGLGRNPIAPYIFANTMTENVDHKGRIHGWDMTFIGDLSTTETTSIERGQDLSGQTVEHRDGRKVKKTPIKGQLGDKIIERAIGRNRKVKLSLDPTIEFQDPPNQKPPDTDRAHTMAAVTGGHAIEPLQLLLGDLAKNESSGIYGYKSIKEQGDHSIAKIEELLIRFALSPNDLILTANTISSKKTPFHSMITDEKSGNKETYYYMDENMFFGQHHAYTITAVDMDQRTVTVVNPHDTRKYRHTISFETFCDYFSQISGVSIDKEKVKERFPEIEFEKEEEMPAIYAAPLETRKNHIFPKLEENEVLHINLGKDHYLVLRPNSETFLCELVRVHSEYDKGNTFPSKPLIPGNVPTILGAKAFKSLRTRKLPQEELEGMQDNHIKIRIRKDNSIEISNLYADAQTTVERKTANPQEKLSKYSKPLIHNTVMPNKAAYLQGPLQEYRKLLLTVGRSSFLILELIGDELKISLHGIGAEETGGDNPITSLKKGEDYVFGRKHSPTLNLPKVSRLHLYIKFGNDGDLYLRDLSTHGTTIH